MCEYIRQHNPHYWSKTYTIPSLYYADVYEVNMNAFFVFWGIQAFPDNAVRREVEHLPAVCINENCTWKGTIKEYEVSSCHAHGIR